MTENRHIPQEDLALYAMQALGAEEQAQVRAHLESCDLCRAHLAETSGTLASLAMSVDQQPVPAGSRERFLERIGATAPPVPRVVSIAGHVPPMKSAAKARSAALWIAWAATAALVLVSAGLSVKLSRANNALARQSEMLAEQSAAAARAQRVLDLLTAPAARHVLLTAGGGHPAPSARAVYMASRGALILEASNLAPVASGKAYELWIIPANGSAPVPAGTFQPDASGNAHLVLPKIPAGVPAKALGITVENASGSATPTLPIVLAGPVSTEGE